MSDAIFIILVTSVISIIASIFGKAYLPKNSDYNDDKKELERLQHQEKMLNKIYKAKKK